MPLPHRTRRLLLALVLVILGGGLTVILLEYLIPEPSFPRLLGDTKTGGPGLTGGALPVRLVLVAGGFSQVTDLQFVQGPPSSPPWLFVLQKPGVARMLRLDRAAAEQAPLREATVFLKVAVNATSEMGLLGLAFHPDFQRNGRFFLHTNPAGPSLLSRVSEWYVEPKLEGATPREVRTVLELKQPFANHDGGQLAFGPDRMLYVAFGDGGSGGDPQGHGQNLQSLLGKILRLDVEQASDAHPYRVPPDNPLVNRPDARPEIWAYGLRNPWRFSFDPHGRLVAADVGQGHWEEVDLIERGANLGWNTREGRHCFSSSTCAHEGFSEPVWEYDHDTGQSITGGYTYLGTRAPSLRGRWLCGDFMARKIWALDLPETSGADASVTYLGQSELMMSTFGRAPDGEVYVADFNSGNVYGFEEAFSR